MTIDKWTITTEAGYGKLPECKPMTFYVIVPPRVRTETRVDIDGLKLVLPDNIYKQYKWGHK